LRTLKYAILGMIHQKPMTGYDLMQEFESTLNEFWSASHSQIYPELKKLTEEGCITYTDHVSDKGPNSKIYTITEKGTEDFLAWLMKDEDMMKTPKDSFRLRVFFSQNMDPEERKDFFTRQCLQHKKRLAHLKENQKKFNHVPKADEEDFGDYLVLMGAIMREESTIAWIEKCMKML
jgi:DNA-binding PadR family transcriptional regulator